MDKRVLLLALAGTVIGGLCAFKMTRKYPHPATVTARPIAAPAPPFELYDQSSPSQFVRLIGYLGRHQILVVFFDGRSGAHASDVLNRLRDEWSRLREADVRVMAISTALPQENRKDIAQHAAFPFPLLSDPDFHVHRAWGRFDGATGTPQQGVFLIDRRGWVGWSRETNAPQPLDSWESAVKELIASP
jgi:peroxiredoxin